MPKVPKSPPTVDFSGETIFGVQDSRTHTIIQVVGGPSELQDPSCIVKKSNGYQVGDRNKQCSVGAIEHQK